MGVAFMEKFGRRTWLIWGAAGQSLFLTVFVGCIAHPGAKTGAAAAAMLFGWAAVFGPTWAPVVVRFTPTRHARNIDLFTDHTARADME